MTTPIPSPPGLPLLGNAFDMDPTDSLLSLMHLAEVYGPIYELRLPSGDQIIVSSYELYNELCDEKRFGKAVAGGLMELRHAIHSGLFSADTGEPAWEIAHRVLTPAFGPLAIRSMFDEMHEISTQLVMKWARFGEESKINVTDDFTRLTLDSISLCAMDTRFNSFYQSDLHPFVQAMQQVLTESGRRAGRPSIVNRLMRASEKQFFEDIDVLQSTALAIVADKKSNPTEKKDLVNAMLNGKDAKTGQKMTDGNIADNMITFLIAGHETTSGLLSFLFYRFMANPSTFQEAQKEVDMVIGTGPITVDHMSKLPYIQACLREALRLNPTASTISLHPSPNNTEDPILIGGGQYLIKPGKSLRMLMPKIHCDPQIYGDDAELFRPERMLDENFEKLPKNAWKPFGNGVRGCIGRGFAWQEAILAVAMLVQNFDFRLVDPGYKLTIKQTLTIKPKDLFMYATLRKGIDPISLEKRVSGGTADAPAGLDPIEPKLKNAVSKGAKKPMTILFGGNMGTCESLAGVIAQSSLSHGYKADVKPLDDATNLPKDRPVLIITASYEGEPPDNARSFISWLTSLDGTPLDGVQYAVFGCGNRDWKDTYQRIPKLTDSLLEKRGAKRLAERGLADAANNDVFNDFEKWEDAIYWPAIGHAFGEEEGGESGALDIEISTTLRSSHLSQDVKDAVVIRSEVLAPDGESPKRHIEVKLPTDMKYRSGDYLAVLPLNHPEVVHRAMKRFGLPWDAMVTIKSAETTLPTGAPTSVYDIMSAYVELNQPATRRNIKTIIKTVTDEATKTELEDLMGDAFGKNITEKRVSVLDLLERYPMANTSLGEFLSMLPQLRLRQYSISSSPLADPSVCTLTMGVLDEEAIQGGKRFHGVASTYLARLEVGDHIQVDVKHSHASFHLPLDCSNIPLIMVCAGTGVAPFRGFVQERAKQIQCGRQLAPALLFIGCTHPEKDSLYKAEFEDWASNGAVDLRYAYSRAPESSNGAKHVQDRFWNDRKDVLEFFQAGAKVYVCGRGRVGEGVKDAAMKMWLVEREESGEKKTEAEADEWFMKLRNERYMSDLFD